MKRNDQETGSGRASLPAPSAAQKSGISDAPMRFETLFGWFAATLLYHIGSLF